MASAPSAASAAACAVAGEALPEREAHPRLFRGLLPILARLPIDPAVAEAIDNGQMETVNTDALSEAIEAVKAVK